MTSAQLARFLCVGCLIALASACASVNAVAQTQTTTAPALGVGGSVPPPLFANANPSDPGQAHMLREMAKERNVLRQKEIIDDTNQLLDLAQQLKAAVDKTNKDRLSLSVVHTAAQIEKLAKAVEKKMREGD